MRRTRTSLLRRVVMWAAGVVLVVSVAAWVASLWGLSYGTAGGDAWLWLAWGDLNAGRGGYPLVGFHVMGFDAPAWSWPAAAWESPSKWFFSIPLWMLALLASVLIVWLFMRGRRFRALAQAGRCPACGYDLTGTTGPCPECGRERESKA